MTKRLLPILAVLVACLAIGAVTASAKGAEVGSTITVKFKGNSDGGVFSGKVGPKECAAGRDVKVKGIGSTETEKSGQYSISTGPIKTGTYQVTAAGTGKCKKVKATIAIKAA